VPTSILDVSDETQTGAERSISDPWRRSSPGRAHFALTWTSLLDKSTRLAQRRCCVLFRRPAQGLPLRHPLGRSLSGTREICPMQTLSVALLLACALCGAQARPGVAQPSLSTLTGAPEPSRFATLITPAASYVPRV
jgi:hypothetical protein